MSALSHKWLIGVKLMEGRGKFVSARKILSDPPSPSMIWNLAEVPKEIKDYMSFDSKGLMQDAWKDVEPYLKKSPKSTIGYTHIASIVCKLNEPFTESMDPDELEALATSVIGPQPVTDKKGTVRWYWRGQLHREDGPASEYVNGSKGWWRNGKRHRDDGPAVEYANGDKEWWRNGEPHRDDGPAIEHVDGYKAWYRNGVKVEPFTESMDPDELEALATSVMGPQPETDDEGTVHWFWRGQRHREDGPAIEYASGSKEWYQNGQLHREDGPAHMGANGDKMWCRNGELHREDGPAIECVDGFKSWYRNGLRHREDGPACEWADGFKEWYRNGQLHREDGPAHMGANGDKEWWRNGELHREDGPAIEWANGSKWWCRNGQPHREDGPAFEGANGDKEWWRNGLLHRDDGPAIEWANGSKSWYRNGQPHREDGPAFEWANGDKEWWRNGVQVKPFTESLDPEELEAIVFSIPPKWEFRWEDETHRNIGIYFQGKGVGKYFIERKPTDAETVKRSIETTFKKYDEIMPYEYGANWMNVWDWYWRIKNSLDAKR